MILNLNLRNGIKILVVMNLYRFFLILNFFIKKNPFPISHLPSKAWQCCAPQTVTDAVDLYVGADEEEIEKICGNSACAASYYSDISKSLNSRGNPLLGCSSGIRVRFRFVLEVMRNNLF